MQFIVKAYDGTDEGALERRMSIRPQHLENMGKVKEYGRILCAGGILAEDGHPIGSVLVMDFESRKLLDDYRASEPYIEHGVWQDVVVEDCNVVILDDEVVGK